MFPGIWLYDAQIPQSNEPHLRLVPIALPPQAELARHLGPFKLEAAWQLKSPARYFGGFSTLLPPAGGMLTAYSDKGWRLRFPLPGTHAGTVEFRPIYSSFDMQTQLSDMEAATRDPETGTIWLASEGPNAIARFGPERRFQKLCIPPEIKDWGVNSAAEAMTRLPDGRFILVREASLRWFDDRDHAALLYDGDPLEGARARPFTMRGISNFSPTELAGLPDGRLLVLMRRAVWPFPARFAGRIAIGDPGEIREGKTWHLHEVARLTSTLPVDNFEGMAVAPRKDGRLTVWLMSDDNSSEFQRTLLWRLSVDPAELPGASAAGVRRPAAGASSARASP